MCIMFGAGIKGVISTLLSTLIYFVCKLGGPTQNVSEHTTSKLEKGYQEEFASTTHGPHSSQRDLTTFCGLLRASCMTSPNQIVTPVALIAVEKRDVCQTRVWQLQNRNSSPLASEKPLPTPPPPSSVIRAVSFCKPLRWCCQASFCEVAPAIKQQWREWLIQQWRWQYSSASIWRQPAGLEPFQTALCFSSEEKSIHNWWQFKERLYCGISNKTSENTENERER